MVQADRATLTFCRSGSALRIPHFPWNLAGITLATRLLDKPALLVDLEKGFRVIDHSLPPKGLKEDLSRKEFEKQYGSLSDARFRKALEDLRKRTRALPGYRDKPSRGPSR